MKRSFERIAWACGWTLVAAGASIGCGGGGGGGGGSTGGGGGGGSSLAASIDGQAWVGDSNVSATTRAASPGTYVLVGSKVTGTTALTVDLTLYNLIAPGTYPLGVGPTVVGGLGSVTEGPTTWLTPLSGAAGTVTVTTLDGATIAGTFSFTAAPMQGSGANREVTAGTFAIPISGTAGTLPPSGGSKMSAALGGASWNAATVVTVNHAGGVYAFAGSNTDYSLNFVLSSINGPGTVALDSTTETLAVHRGSQLWSSQLGGGSGSVTFTSVSASRIQGTFSATLQGSMGAGTLTIADGAFDVGLP